MPDLKVRYNLVTSQTRIPLVQNGTVDLECGSTTNNEERAQQVDFSVGFFEIGTRLLTATDSGINGFDDLAGKIWSLPLAPPQSDISANSTMKSS